MDKDQLPIGWVRVPNPSLPDLLASWGYVLIDNNLAEFIKPYLSRPWPGRLPGSVYWEQQGRPDLCLAKEELYKDCYDNYWVTPWLKDSAIYAGAVRRCAVALTALDTRAHDLELDHIVDSLMDTQKLAFTEDQRDIQRPR